ncbi:MAG: dihydropteroate synthase [Halobacteriaceae archaeon]
MRFHEAADYLLDLRRFRMRPGTDSTADLLARVGDPQTEYACVQVAGSNGKGSTSRMVESALREAGLDVGLYTSPHFDDLRERVRVNGRKASKRAVTEFVAELRDHVDERAAAGESPTFFEAVTAFALWEFARSDVDVAVLEVGIGGRHDATSVVDPIASAVTTVALEHTAILGDTVEEIARDQASVAPRENPLVTAATGGALEAARETAGDVVTVGEAGDEGPPPDVRVAYGGRTNAVEAGVEVRGEGWAVEGTVPLLGEYQARNAGVAVVLARQVADRLGVDLPAGTLARGLRKAHWPGRFEVLSTDPLVVLDGAHNPDACAGVARTLSEFDYDDLALVFGAMHDKDHAGMAEALPDADRVVTCRPDLDRAESQDVLARVFADRAGEVEAVSSVETALERALADVDGGDAVVVTGSLYAVAEARRRWTRVEIPKRVRDLEDAREVLEGAHVTDAGVWRMRGKGVHRVLKTRVQRRQAQYLKEEMLSLGGECAVSGLNDQEEEPLDVVLMGTLAQFRRLVEKLGAQPYGLGVLAEEVREALDIRTEEPREGYPWEDGTAVMGILNVTPDSFHDGGEHATPDSALDRAEEMVAAGADIVDVGGESTRPGAEPVPAETERDRVVPTVEALADEDVLVSVDTRKAEVARAALEAGADLINDVSGLADPEMRFVVAEYGAPVVVMHSIDAPVVPDRDVEYDDVVEDVIDELRERVLLAEKAGLPREKVIVDPGLGFGKSAAESFELLDRCDELHALDCPVLVGHSHKSMFGSVDRYPDEGGYATVAATALAAERGADVVRVHDVAENVAAVRTVEAARGRERGGD